MRKLMVIGAMALAGCTATTEIKRPGGTTESVVMCGAALPWSVCYNSANKACPTGWTTVAEKAGINRKELTYVCPAR